MLINVVKVEDVPELLSELAPKPLKDVMTAQEVADYFGVSKSSVLKWMRDKDNPLPAGFFGSDPRFYREDVKAWSKNNAEKRLNALHK